MVNHGGAELYHKNTGISQPGFDRLNCWLQRWEIPVPANVFLYYQHYKQKCGRYRDMYYQHQHGHHHPKYKASTHGHSGHHGGGAHDENIGLWIAKIRKTVSASRHRPNRQKQKLKNSHLPCFVGLEFECFKGHRAILDYHEMMELERRAGTVYEAQFDDESGGKSAKSMKSESDGDPLRFVATSFPRHDIPLRVPCKQCLHFRSGTAPNTAHSHSGHSGGSIVNSQLQRTFIVTPPSPITVEAKPVIKATGSDAVFEVDSPVVLPPSSFLVLRFPYIYFHEARGLPPDKLRLCKGMLTVQSDVDRKYQEQLQHEERLRDSEMNSISSSRAVSTPTTPFQVTPKSKWKTPAKRTAKKIVIKMKEKESVPKEPEIEKEKVNESKKEVESEQK